MRSNRSPVELAWICMCGTFPAIARCSPLAEKVMVRTSVVCWMVACRVSCASQIFTVCPAAVAAVPKMEFELAWEGEIATAFTSSLWALLFGGAWGTFQSRVVRSAEDAMIRRSEATRSVILAWRPSEVWRIAVWVSPCCICSFAVWVSRCHTCIAWSSQIPIGCPADTNRVSVLNTRACTPF